MRHLPQIVGGTAHRERPAGTRRRGAGLWLALPCALWLAVGPSLQRAAAQDAEVKLAAQTRANAPASAPQAEQLEPGVLPALAAVVPGVLLRGSGTFVAKDRRTAKRLLLGAGVGLALFVGSGAVLAATGTSRRLVTAFVPGVLAGSGLFFMSWLADIYGASTGGRDAVGQTISPPLEWELGYRYVYDPQFDFRSFTFARGDLRHGGWRASPSAWVAVDDDNQRLSLELGRRLYGRHARGESNDGSYLDLTHGLLYHRYGDERFAVWTPTAAIEGRIDLRHVADSLRGAFVEGQLGVGLEVYAFDAPLAQSRDDIFGLLLARYAFGVYFGSGRARTGEATVYYDHRHDDFAAGLGVGGIGSGVLGHIGTAAHYYFDEHWGISGLLEVGSAVVTGLSARYRMAAPRLDLARNP